jgi:hypothetical protein
LEIYQLKYELIWGSTRGAVKNDTKIGQRQPADSSRKASRCEAAQQSPSHFLYCMLVLFNRKLLLTLYTIWRSLPGLQKIRGEIETSQRYLCQP